jgi:hypothetical protein
MGDLVVAVLALTLGLLLVPLGAPPAVAAAASTATMVIWPGYIAVAGLWPSRRQMGVAQRLALIPFLSILASSLIGLCCWAVIPATTAPLIQAGTLAVGLVSAIAVGAWRWRRDEDMHRDVLLGACGLCAALAVAVGMAVAVPRSISAEQPAAIYIDPAAKLTSNQKTDSIGIPLVVVGAADQARLTAEVSGRTGATQIIGPAAGALRIVLSIPRSSLSPKETRAVDIRLENGSGGQIVQLRLQLKSSL